MFAGVLMLSACHKEIWDKLNDHEERIAKLETFCNQLNTNINSLKDIVDVLNTKDCVEDVVPVMENGKLVGYRISFTKHNPITIYNGTDGKDGKDGTDGHTPVVGIKQDTDGFWYWTLDGDWLLDADSHKVRADGGTGTDGVTPRLKIDQDYWWISYDNGVSWSKLGKAVGENGKDGDSMFREVRQDETYVYIVLADGEEIKIAKGGLHWVYV